jgi:hypothetical protein
MGGNRRGEKKGDIIDLVRSHGTEMTQINPTEFEKIARCIEHLPSDLLREQCQTQEQKQEWQNARNTQGLTAECWRAKFIDPNREDAIARALDRQEISPQKKELIPTCPPQKPIG